MPKPSTGACATRAARCPTAWFFISSHVSADLGRCFQLMQASDATLLQRWVAEWSDLAQFEIVPVVAGSDTATALAASL